MKNEVYYSDYENEPIGDNNPYYRCIHCKISDPEINGRLEGHAEWCEYRIKKEQELKIKNTNDSIEDLISKIKKWYNRNKYAIEMGVPSEEVEEIEKELMVILG